MSETINKYDEIIGKSEIFTANALVVARVVGSWALARNIKMEPDYQTWGNMLFFDGLAITDVIDGRSARKGRKRLGMDESIRRPLSSYPDHLADKYMVNKVLFAIAQREEENGNHLYARFLKVFASINLTRDILTTADRALAEINRIDTRAKKSGKIKAVVQDIACTAALSPMSKTSAGKIIATGLIGLATINSVTSGIEMHKHYQDEFEKKFTGSQDELQ